MNLTTPSVGTAPDGRIGRAPRTLAEAWPIERYPYAVERARSGRYDRIASYLLAISIGTALALLLFYNL
jgi:hypothetical protein